jgi:hypothetical protein
MVCDRCGQAWKRRKGSGDDRTDEEMSLRIRYGAVAG